MPKHNSFQHEAKNLKFPNTEKEQTEFENVVYTTYGKMIEAEGYYKPKDLYELLFEFINQETPKQVLASFKNNSGCSFKKVKEISQVPSGTVNRMTCDGKVNYHEGGNRYKRKTITKIAMSFIDYRIDRNPDFTGEYNEDNIKRLTYACDPYERIEDFKSDYMLNIDDQNTLDLAVVTILKLANKEF